MCTLYLEEKKLLPSEILDERWCRPVKEGRKEWFGDKRGAALSVGSLSSPDMGRL